MPFRIDIDRPPKDALDRLVLLGALDVEANGRGLAALMPDGVTPQAIVEALGPVAVAVSPAKGRDGDSVWVLGPRRVRAGGVWLVPPGVEAPADAIRLIDGSAFGTGLHPTTALCLDAMEAILEGSSPERVLDVGAGSGVLALAALRRGVDRAVGIDVDPDALRVAADNARLNGLGARLHLVRGGPEAIGGAWPLVLANVLAAPLVEMAPLLARRVARGGALVLSGIPASVAPDVERAYRNLGMQRPRTATRGGWTALVFAPSW